MRIGNYIFMILFAMTSCDPNTTHLKQVNEKAGECGEVPIGVTLNKADLDLAGAKMGDFSLSKLDIKYTPDFQKIISEAATNDLVRDSLTCKAIARAGVRNEPLMVDYFMRLTYFLSRERTVEEQIKWREANPLPKKQGKLKLSGPRADANRRILEFSDRVAQRVFGVINVGDAPLTWWYDHFPEEYFYSDFHLGEKSTLDPRQGLSVDVILKGGDPKKRTHEFKIKTDTDEEATVLLQITGSPYPLLGAELNERLLAKDASFSKLTDNALVIKKATELVDEKYHDASNSSKQYLVTRVLLAANFPDAALRNLLAGSKFLTIVPKGDLGIVVDLENGARVDDGIQHLKWAIRSGKEGKQSESAHHIEKAYHIVDRVSLPPETIKKLTDAKREARGGATGKSLLDASAALADLQSPYPTGGQNVVHEEFRHTIPEIVP